MSRVLSLAGFQVTFIGRFWVITEAVFRVTCASRSLFVTHEVKIGIAFDALADALHQSGPL